MTLLMTVLIVFLILCKCFSWLLRIGFWYTVLAGIVVIFAAMIIVAVALWPVHNALEYF